jgi:hypothetical protein
MNGEAKVLAAPMPPATNPRRESQFFEQVIFPPPRATTR